MTDGTLGKEYADGEVICRQGEPGDCMYVVQEGRVEILCEENGALVLVRELTAADIFGEMAIFEREPRSATARAKGKAYVVTLDKRAFLRRVHEDPSLAYRMLQMMSYRIRSLTEELLQQKRSIREQPLPKPSPSTAPADDDPSTLVARRGT